MYSFDKRHCSLWNRLTLQCLRASLAAENTRRTGTVGLGDRAWKWPLCRDGLHKALMIFSLQECHERFVLAFKQHRRSANVILAWIFQYFSITKCKQTSPGHELINLSQSTSTLINTCFCTSLLKSFSKLFFYRLGVGGCLLSRKNNRESIKYRSEKRKKSVFTDA